MVGTLHITNENSTCDNNRLPFLKLYTPKFCISLYFGTFRLPRPTCIMNITNKKLPTGYLISNCNEQCGSAEDIDFDFCEYF